MWRCRDLVMWRCRCRDVRCGDVAMWRCRCVMWRCGDVAMWRCGDVAMWRRIFKVCAVIRTRPNGPTPANQLLDSSSSSASNYRAAGRARSKKEFTSKLGIANEEADETVYWLDYIANTGLGNGLDLLPLQRKRKSCEQSSPR